MPHGPQPSSSILVFTVPGKISIKCFPKLLPKSKGRTWVKRSDGDSGKVFCPVGGEHAAAELGVGVGGVGGERGLRVEEGEGGGQGGRLGDRAGDDEAR